MAATNGIVWVLASRWERPGRHAELRASIHAPSLVGWGGDLTQVFPLFYPVLVVVAPGWTYEGWFNWSSGIDVTLQVIGLGLWGLGMVVAIWAARVMGGYIAVNGVTVDHELVTRGPYRYVRHPVYASLIAAGLGTALLFRSYLLIGVAAAYLGERDGIDTVDRSELAARLKDRSVVVLDVRPEHEFSAGHIAGARSVPIAELRKHLKVLPSDVEVVAYCRGPYCVYAADAVRELAKRGFKAARLVDGFPEWQRAGLPVASGT